MSSGVADPTIDLEALLSGFVQHVAAAAEAMSKIGPALHGLATALSEQGLVGDQSSPDTSNPCFLDLIGRIDEATGR